MLLGAEMVPLAGLQDVALDPGDTRTCVGRVLIRAQVKFTVAAAGDIKCVMSRDFGFDEATDAASVIVVAIAWEFEPGERADAVRVGRVSPGAGKGRDIGTADADPDLLGYRAVDAGRGGAGEVDRDLVAGAVYLGPLEIPGGKVITDFDLIAFAAFGGDGEGGGGIGEGAIINLKTVAPVKGIGSRDALLLIGFSVVIFISVWEDGLGSKEFFPDIVETIGIEVDHRLAIGCRREDDEEDDEFGGAGT